MSRMVDSVKHVSRETLHPLVLALKGIKDCPRCGKPMRWVGTRWRCDPCRAAYQRKWRAAHPLSDEQRAKDIARSIANVAVKRGQLVPKPCEKCGAEPAQKHHEDYSKPLDVIWLCAACHTAGHYPGAEAIKIKPRRRRIMHGNTVCSTCLAAEPRKGGWDCNSCHALAEQRRRDKKKLTADHKGKDNGRSGQGQGGGSDHHGRESGAC